MGTVPEAYYQFVMHYAPYFYVIPTAMAADASAGQKNVTVADGSNFQAGFPVEIKDDAHSEWNEVDSVAGNVVTMKNNLQYTYYVNKNGKVEGPDPSFMRGAFPASFAIEFLYEAYSASQEIRLFFPSSYASKLKRFNLRYLRIGISIYSSDY